MLEGGIDARASMGWKRRVHSILNESEKKYEVNV